MAHIFTWQKLANIDDTTGDTISEIKFTDDRGGTVKIGKESAELFLRLTHTGDVNVTDCALKILDRDGSYTSKPVTEKWVSAKCEHRNDSSETVYDTYTKIGGTSTQDEVTIGIGQKSEETIVGDTLGKDGGEESTAYIQMKAAVPTESTAGTHDFKFVLTYSYEAV